MDEALGIISRLLDASIRMDEALGVISRLLDASIHRNIGPRGADGRMAHGTCMVCCEDASRGVLAVVAGCIRLSRDDMHASGS